MKFEESLPYRVIDGAVYSLIRDRYQAVVYRSLTRAHRISIRDLRRLRHGYYEVGSLAQLGCDPRDP